MSSSRVVSKRTCVALLLALLPSLAPRLRHPVPSLHPADFNVYYMASLLVREGMGSQIYKGADTGADPQKMQAPIGSPIEVAARSQGVSGIDMYLYPPLLADMMTPLTHERLRTAVHTWLSVNLVLLVGTSASLIVLLDLEWFSLGALLVLVGAFSFTPVVDCFIYGQITILLLFLWSLGTALHAKGYTVLSGVVFALAAAIKLTPAIVVIPFIVWRNWKWVSAFTVSIIGYGGVCAVVNTPATLSVYFHRVMPAMTRSAPELSNMSISAGTQLMAWALRGHAVFPDPPPMPTTIVLMGKLVSLALLIAFVAVIARLGRGIAVSKQVVVLSLLALLAPIVSPVSWLHAYSVAFIAFAVLWKGAMRGISKINLALLTASSIMIGSYVWLGLMLRIHRHSIASATGDLFVLFTAVALVFYELTHLQLKQPNLYIMEARPTSNGDVGRRQSDAGLLKGA